MEQVYTSSEARKILEVSTSSFKRLVDTGKIRKVTPPNKKQGFYIKEDVDKIANDMKRFMDVYTGTSAGDKIEVETAKSEKDIKATVQIAKQHFGDRAYGLEKRLAWFNKVPNGDYVLKHNGVIVGYFSIQSVTHEAMERIFYGKGGGIQLDDLVPLEPGRPTECYVSGIATKLEAGGRYNREYGMLLLMGLFNTLIALGEQGIDIPKIWAMSGSVTGIKLGRDLGFTELDYVNNEQIGFVLDLKKSTYPPIAKYRESLKNAPAWSSRTL